MVRTRVGYCGGTTKNPSYYKIGDHTETLQLDYDPSVITYEQLLAIFWSAHNPCEQANSRQYMTIVFYHNETQKKIAERTQAEAEKRLKRKIQTPVLPLTEFTLAEDYHQRYYLKNRREIHGELRAHYPTEREFLHSTATMRVNAFLGHYGKLATLEKEVATYGLSESARKTLVELVKLRGE